MGTHRIDAAARVVRAHLGLSLPGHPHTGPCSLSRFPFIRSFSSHGILCSVPGQHPTRTPKAPKDLRIEPLPASRHSSHPSLATSLALALSSSVHHRLRPSLTWQESAVVQKLVTLVKPQDHW